MACHGIDGAFQHRDVNIGWFPFRAIRDTEVRTIPGAGNVVVSARAGDGFGVQSERNPHAKAIVRRRRAELDADGRPWVWCYRRQRTGTGWVCLQDIASDPDPSKPPLRGPAKVDFEVGRTQPRPHSASGCGRDIRDRPRAERTRVVKAVDVYLRYSPRGTAKHYLHHGDGVLLVLASAGTQGFVFVQVLSSTPGNPAKPGTRGWLQSAALRGP